MTAISYLIAIVILSIASYTDLKTRTAPNILWLIMGILGFILLFFSPFDLLYIILVIIILVMLLAMFYCIESVGGADIKAMMALAILFPYPLPGGFVPPVYFIVSYASVATMLSMPIVKLYYPKATFKDIMFKYKYPFLVSLLIGVITMAVIGDITIPLL